MNPQKKTNLFSFLAAVLGLLLSSALLVFMGASGTKVEAMSLDLSTQLTGMQKGHIRAFQKSQLEATNLAAIHTVCTEGFPTCDFASLQGAVDAAGGGDLIKVAAGTYTDIHVRNNYTQVVYISKTLTIQSGYTTTNWLVPDPLNNLTTLNAGGNGRGMHITGAISPTIFGLKITGGEAAGQGGDTFWGQDAGGGIYIFQADAQIQNNQIIQNNAENGGGVYLSSSAASLKENYIASNTSNAEGGGVGMLDSSATLRENTILDNASSWGGGLYLHSSPALLVQNTIQSNHASGRGGGGLFLWWSDARLEANDIISNTTIWNTNGGVHIFACDPTLTNNMIVNNQAGGVRVEGSNPHFMHNTIAHNGEGGIGLYVTEYQDIFGGWHYGTSSLTNTIIVSHTNGISVTAGNTATLDGTFWGDGSWANAEDWMGAGMIFMGTVNVWGDPVFSNPDQGNYHLLSTSEAIDAGITVPLGDDFDGDSRPLEGGYDIGADEYTIWNEPYAIFIPMVNR
jgi:hypothetical protein